RSACFGSQRRCFALARSCIYQQASPSPPPLPRIPSWRSNRRPPSRGLPLCPLALPEGVRSSVSASPDHYTRSLQQQEPECECALFILDPSFLRRALCGSPSLASRGTAETAQSVYQRRTPRPEDRKRFLHRLSATGDGAA